MALYKVAWEAGGKNLAVACIGGRTLEDAEKWVKALYIYTKQEAYEIVATLICLDDALPHFTRQEAKHRHEPAWSYYVAPAPRAARKRTRPRSETRKVSASHVHRSKTVHGGRGRKYGIKGRKSQKRRR